MSRRARRTGIECSYCGAASVSCARCLYCKCYRYKHTAETCEARAARNAQVADIMSEMGLPADTRFFETRC